MRTPDGTIIVFAPDGSTATEPKSINASGSITGQFTDGSGVIHGFLRTADGTITRIDPEGSTSTQAFSINDEGIITGVYTDQSGHGVAFIRIP